MLFFDKILRKYGVCLLLFFPIFYFSAGAYFRFILEDLSLRSVDPDFVYYMTGLNISEGYIKVKHIDHPGSPLQYLIAVFFRIVWLFRKNPSGYVNDVLSHADLYLSIANLAITAIISVVLFAAGKYVYKKTGSLLYAIIIQTLPFISVILYQLIGRITPELLLPLPLIALSVFVLNHIYDTNEKTEIKNVLIFGLILAFSLSLKLTLLPLWILPLVIVKSWKSKLTVFITAIVFFLIIAFPVTLQIEKFWHWTKDLVIHSGQYGNGEKNVIDINVFKQNIGQIYQLQKYFWYLFAALTLLIIPAFISFNKKKSSRKNKLIRVAFALLLTIIVQTIISSKHFAPRYFMPALMLTPLMIIVIAEIVKELLSFKLTKTILSIAIILFLIWDIKQQRGVINYTSEAFEKQVAARKQTRNIIKTFEENSIKIIVSQDYGCPFEEYALHFSTVWSAPELRENYINKLAALYPNTYQFTTWDGNFINWGSPLNIEKLTLENRPVYLYLEKNTEELYKRTIEKLTERAGNFSLQKKLIFENQFNGEAILQLFFENASVANENK